MIGKINSPDRITKIQYERYLNDLGFPEGFEGKKTAKSRYGAWLKRTDPTAFDVGYAEWERQEYIRRNRK